MDCASPKEPLSTIPSVIQIQGDVVGLFLVRREKQHTATRRRAELQLEITIRIKWHWQTIEF